MPNDDDQKNNEAAEDIVVGVFKDGIFHPFKQLPDLSMTVSEALGVMSAEEMRAVLEQAGTTIGAVPEQMRNLGEIPTGDIGAETLGAAAIVQWIGGPAQFALPPAPSINPSLHETDTPEYCPHCGKSLKG